MADQSSMQSKDNTHSPISVTGYLKGIHFPASRDDLVAQAKKNHAGKDVLEQIAALPEGDFKTVADVTKAFGHSH